MPSRESEALVLRSYSLREADLVVSFFTRERGKLRGVAKGVRKPKSRFGGALERLACSRIFYLQKENAELVTLQRAELAGPANLWKAGYPASVILDVIAETSDHVLPEGQPHDAYFRLLKLVVEEFHAGIARDGAAEAVPFWAHRALVYFLLWNARLGGWLPPLDRCIETDRPFAESEPAYFSPHRDGLFGAAFKDADSWLIPPESRSLAALMLRSLPGRIEDSAGFQAAARYLERYLLQRAQAQTEKRLRGIAALRSLWDESGR